MIIRQLDRGEGSATGSSDGERELHCKSCRVAPRALGAGCAATSRTVRSFSGKTGRSAVAETLWGVVSNERRVSVGRASDSPERRTPQPDDFSNGSAAFRWSGATGFEPATTCTSSAVTNCARGGETSQPLGNTRAGDPAGSNDSPEVAAFRGNFAATLLLALGDVDCLLTVADLARMLRLSKATVYKLVAEGKMLHVRMGNAIRFVTGQVSPAHPAPPGRPRGRRS